MAGGRVSATITLLLFLHAAGSFNVAAPASPAVLSFGFDFSNASSYGLEDLRFEGDASLNGGAVDLTCNCRDKAAAEHNRCRGRMSYNHLVPLYDDRTGVAASFATSFTFVINGVEKGDGMTFFLSGYPSRLPPVSSAGSFLGLTNNGETTASGANRFVAVEFDTYADPWDPTGCYDHIGIDVSSVISVSATRLPSYSLNGTMTASITFDGSTRVLEVSLNFDSNHSLDAAQVKTRLPNPLHALLPPKVAVGFSAASTTGANSELHQILSWSFNSTVLAPKGRCSLDTRVIIAGAVLSVALIWFTLSWITSKRARIAFVRRSRLADFRRFEYRDLAEATGNFSDANLLGAGSSGVVHKGILKSRHGGTTEALAVKRINDSTFDVASTFFSEFKVTSETDHKNLVKIKGWCRLPRVDWNLSDFLLCRERKLALVLVYELVPNGSLYDHLFRPRHAVLPWTTRFEIARGIASGLCYLHHECKPYILHRDIKPGNILLDADFVPKLADFGLSRVANSNDLVPLTLAVGTKGYMDPLCMKDGEVRFGRPSDVYSFGVVLLDIACTGKTADEVREMYRSRTGMGEFVEGVAHVKLHGAFDRTQMQQVCVLGLWCCLPDDACRPCMLDAVRVLENDAALLEKGMAILENHTPLMMEVVDDDDGGDLSGREEEVIRSGEGDIDIAVADDQPLMQTTVRRSN